MSYTFNPFTGNLDVTPFSLDGAGKIPSDYLPIGSGGEVELNLGSAGSPSLFFNGDANTGLYSPGADQVAISTSGTGRLFVDASGQVGIGAAPLSGHQFTVNGSNLARICLQTAALGQTTADGFSLETDSSATYFTNRENTPSIFYTNNTERLRITSDAYVRLASGTGGIQFNGDTAAANALDDYEEGTFTPTVIGTSTAGTGTYSTQNGRYIKIGTLVFVEVAMEWSAHTGTGSMWFSGLPFTSGASSTGAGIIVGRINNIALTAGNYLSGYQINNSVNIALRQLPTGGGAEGSVALDTAGAINYSICYSTF